ncbi:hypothetical protein KEM60_00529 [Austwickia sp. TVS 96-490-7B]|nr:hypothetical protein [Austwickia sp. TVS 96-490-7B]
MTTFLSGALVIRWQAERRGRPFIDLVGLGQVLQLTFRLAPTVESAGKCVVIGSHYDDRHS